MKNILLGTIIALLFCGCAAMSSSTIKAPDASTSDPSGMLPIQSTRAIEDTIGFITY